MECKELCIPKSTVIELEIPQNLPLVTQKEAIQPHIKIIKKRRSINISIPENIKVAEFFPYENNQFKTIKQTYKKGTLKIPLINKDIKNISGELFINNKSKGILIEEDIKPAPGIKNIIFILLSAFVGGLILNIMPCVLPILGIKAIQLKANKPGNPVKEAILYWFGIFSSLQILFGMLIGLKLSGKAVGWGFQLQSPIVIQLLTFLFIIIIAVNLDILRIPLPRFASKKSNGMFFNGVLTTIVATPCTAPFLGSALAFALFQSFLTGIGIFLFISFGLALPMILLIINPTLSQFLPKTNAWNNRFKYSLNFGFILTIGWLMWILNAQINVKNYITFYTTLILLLTVLIVRSKQYSKKVLIIFTTTILLCSIPIITNKPALSEWKPYTPELVELLEVNKKPFFIDITAKWCVTCQTNKLAVLNTKKANQLFESKNITLIVADWTNKTDEITNLLTKHDKVSIPTYIYYDGSNYTIFSDILTFTKLRENLNK